MDQITIEQRTKSLEKLLGTNSINDFLIDGAYHGIPLNKPLPANTPAHRIYEIENIYMGAYDDGGFYECCLEEFAAMYLDVRDLTQPKHYVNHMTNISENTKKENAWQLYCLSNEQSNQKMLIQFASAIKYPNVLNKYFKNFKNNPNDSRGCLEKNYSTLPWTLDKAKRIVYEGTYPDDSAIYQFIKHLPTESTNNSFWMQNPQKQQDILKKIENQIQYGIIPEVTENVWEIVKTELPQACGFNNLYSWNTQEIINCYS